MKKLFALLLALALAAGLALPAAAAGEDVPVITVQPQSISAAPETMFTLSVAAHAPNGDPVSYQWYQRWDVDGSLRFLTGYTQATYTAKASSSGGRTFKHAYFCRVTNTVTGESVDSDPVRVTEKKPSAKELMEIYKGYLDNGLSLRENMKKDPLYLINGMMEKSSAVLMICVMWLMDLLGVPDDRLESLGGNAVQGIAMVTMIPLMVIYALVFALPVSLVMLPFNMG